MRPELDETLAAPGSGAGSGAGSGSGARAGVAAATAAPSSPIALPTAGKATVAGHAAAVGHAAAAVGHAAAAAGHAMTLAAGVTATGIPGAPASPEAFSPSVIAGQQLGHFRIDKPLGAGGMGEVYLATDLALDRPVAIKVLPAQLARDPARRDRMIREARAQARVSHPNVGHIYFIGEELGRLYFAMEYVAGQTVADRIAAGPISVDDALSIVRSAALGLREAQRSGITHRDVKPSNLMIDGHGMVKVLDFGLAAGDPGAVGDGPVAQTSLAGTPLYMAPEQARGEPVDCRADIYALGATLFHLVSGKPPFEADTVDALLSKHASAERPTLPRRAGMPRTMISAVDALIGRMMAPAAADRFASYDELIRAIELTSDDHVRPAGFWVRSMANLIDLLLASLAIGAVIGLLSLTTHWLDGDKEVGGWVFAAYALVAILLISRRGHTPGQSLFELEVAEIATGRRPGLRRTAIRVLIPFAIPLVSYFTGEVLHVLGYSTHGVTSPITAISSCAPVVLLLWASLRSHGKLAPWDRWSGTMVRYRSRRPTTI